MHKVPRPKGREAIKAWHRQKIIDATIDVITRHGIAGTTVARVVERADVSMGLVNVHFKSKQMLLGEVLRQMADEYKSHWRAKLERVPADPVARLRQYLSEAGHWAKDDEEALIAACTEKVEAAVAEYLAMPPRPPETMFDHLYAELPAPLAEQRATVAQQSATSEIAAK